MAARDSERDHATRVILPRAVAFISFAPPDNTVCSQVSNHAGVGPRVTDAGGHRTVARVTIADRRPGAYMK